MDQLMAVAGVGLFAVAVFALAGWQFRAQRLLLVERSARVVSLEADADQFKRELSTARVARQQAEIGQTDLSERIEALSRERTRVAQERDTREAALRDMSASCAVALERSEALSRELARVAQERDTRGAALREMSASCAVAMESNEALSRDLTRVAQDRDANEVALRDLSASHASVKERNDTLSQELRRVAEDRDTKEAKLTQFTQELKDASEALTAAQASQESLRERLDRQISAVAYVDGLPTLWQLIFAMADHGQVRAAFNTRPRDSWHYGQASKGLKNLTADYAHLKEAIPQAVAELGIPGLTVCVGRAGVCDLVTMAFCEGDHCDIQWSKVAACVHGTAEEVLFKCSTGYVVRDATDPVSTVNNAVFLAFKAEVACRQQIGLNDYTSSSWLRKAIKRFDLHRNAQLWSDYESVQKRLEDDSQLNDVNVLFQPKYSRVRETASWRLSGAEALIRYGTIGAFPLVAALRDRKRLNDCTTTRVIPAISRMIGQLRRASDAQNRFSDDFRISFNVFPSDLTPEHARDIVKAVLNSCSGNHFEVEILEEGDPGANMNEAIDVLRNGGLSIALDDFGDRMANLERLLSTMPDKVKLDQKIVRPSIDMDRVEFLRTIVAALDSADIRNDEYAREHSRVVAEGAESVLHLDALVGIGVREVQGFIFSKPLPADEFVELYRWHREVDQAALPLKIKNEQNVHSPGVAEVPVG